MTSYYAENKFQLLSVVNVACVIRSFDDLSLPSPSASNTPLCLLLCDPRELLPTLGPGHLPGMFCSGNLQGWHLLVFRETWLLSLEQPPAHPVTSLAHGPVSFPSGL